MTRGRSVLAEQDIQLTSGQEWHSKPLELFEGDVVTVSATGNDKFYAGLYSRPAYIRRRGAAAGMFDFPFGGDRRGFTTKETIAETDDYYVVLRVGVFTPGTTTVHLRVVVERDIEAEAARRLRQE